MHIHVWVMYINDYTSKCMYMHFNTFSEMHIHVHTFPEIYLHVWTIYMICIYYSIVHSTYISCTSFRQVCTRLCQVGRIPDDCGFQTLYPTVSELCYRDIYGCHESWYWSFLDIGVPDVIPNVFLIGRSWLSWCSRPYNISRGSIIQCIKLYSIVSPSKGTDKPAGVVMMLRNPHCRWSRQCCTW